MAVKDLVDNAVTENQVAIFSKSWCPHCKKAKALFQENYPSANTKVFELDEREDGQAIQDYLLEKTGQKTVPNIFVNKQHLGGNSDVQAAQKSGKLAGLVNA